MDNIWDRKSFEVGGHWPMWRGWKNRMTTQNRQKSNAQKKAHLKRGYTVHVWSMSESWMSEYMY